MKQLYRNTLLALFVIFATTCALSLPVNAQVRLTGANTYKAVVDGSADGCCYNNTLGDDRYYFNLYLFTGSVSSPHWLNSGDTNASLNPNLTLAPGTYTLQFVGDGMIWPYLGLHLYFDDDNMTPRITAFASRDGSGIFSVVPDGTWTRGQLDYVLSSGSLSYTSNNTIVELTDLRYRVLGMDLVGPFNNSPGGYNQNAVGSFTLTVRPVGPVPPVTVSGTVTLEGSTKKDQPLFFVFIPVAGGQVFSRSLLLQPNGNFRLENIPRGQYNVWIKGDKWLAKSVPIDTWQGDVSDLKPLLLAGDANNDNFVDMLDLALLIPAFGSDFGDPNWNEAADLNCDASVDLLDLDLLIRNFDTAGDF